MIPEGPRGQGFEGNAKEIKRFKSLTKDISEIKNTFKVLIVSLEKIP
jgi:hypothetical protein